MAREVFCFLGSGADNVVSFTFWLNAYHLLKALTDQVAATPSGIAAMLTQSPWKPCDPDSVPVSL